MDELLAAVAEELDAPAEMVERSAEARAKADGVSVEDVLRAWSGGEAVPAAAAPAAATPAPATTAASAAPAAPAAPIVPRADDEGSLIAAAAVKMNMPESMIRRSAAARAKAAETDVHSVLMEWAGVDPDAPIPEQPPAPAAATPEPEAPATPASAAPAASGLDAGAILAAAAKKMGMPESMVERSAGARAKAQGVDVATVLAEWAGVDATAAPAAPADTPTPAPAAPAPAAPAVAPAPAPVETAAEPEEASVPDEPEEPVDEFESEEEAAMAGALPRWLAALFVVIPAIAIGYALFLPNGPNCGDAGSLAVDPVTGLAVNCDGSEYGSEDVDLFALGMSIYEGSCSACHGPNGAGVANFPGFTGGELLVTFPQDSCSAQIEWIALGTTAWPDATYGANNKAVGGSGAVMPGFAANLSPQELAGVALYERVAFGGQDIEAATVDCTAGGETEATALGE